MYINFDHLKSRGFSVQVDQKGVDITPTHPRDIGPVVDLLKTEFGLPSMYAWDIAERVHLSQVLAAISDIA